MGGFGNSKMKQQSLGCKVFSSQSVPVLATLRELGNKMLQSPTGQALKLQSCIHAFGYCPLVPQFHTLLEARSSSKFQLLTSKTLANIDEPELWHSDPRL